MSKPILPSTSSKRAKKTHSRKSADSANFRRRPRNRNENSDVLISAVISKDLLLHLHQILQRAELAAQKQGKTATKINYGELRKVLCMDARSMKDASAVGTCDEEIENSGHGVFGSKVA